MHLRGSRGYYRRILYSRFAVHTAEQSSYCAVQNRYILRTRFPLRAAPTKPRGNAARRKGEGSSVAADGVVSDPKKTWGKVRERVLAAPPSAAALHSAGVRPSSSSSSDAQCVPPSTPPHQRKASLTLHHGVRYCCRHPVHCCRCTAAAAKLCCCVLHAACCTTAAATRPRGRR